MKKHLRYLYLSLLVPWSLNAGTVLFDDFTTNPLSNGWAQTPLWGYGHSDFAQGRVNAYPIDTGVQLQHPVTVSASATELTLSWTGSIAYSYWGDAQGAYLGTANGDRYYVWHGFGDNTGNGAGSQMTIDVGRATNNNGPGITDLLNRSFYQKAYDSYSFSVTFTDGFISGTARANTSGQVLPFSANAPTLDINAITTAGLSLYTTTEATVWIDNYQLVEKTGNSSHSVPDSGSALAFCLLGTAAVAGWHRRRCGQTRPQAYPA